MNTVTCDIGEECKRTLHLVEMTFIGVNRSLSMFPIQDCFSPGLFLYPFHNLRIRTFNVSEVLFILFLPNWHLGKDQQRFEYCRDIFLSPASVTSFRVFIQSFIHTLLDLNN